MKSLVEQIEDEQRERTAHVVNVTYYGNRRVRLEVPPGEDWRKAVEAYLDAAHPDRHRP